MTTAIVVLLVGFALLAGFAYLEHRRYNRRFRPVRGKHRERPPSTVNGWFAETDGPR